MEKLAYVIPVMTSDPAVELSAKMLEMLGVDRGHVYFTSSGSEANETAFKIVRQFHLQSGNSRKSKIILCFIVKHFWHWVKTYNPNLKLIFFFIFFC